MDNKRIDWIDICKGILIILMVIGHSTGLFNKYIYQFHMAAFFFLSGYVAHPEKRSLFHTLYDKFFTILLPTIITVLFGLAILWLMHLGHCDVLFSSWEYPGWAKSLSCFFGYGDIYVDVLGANWFLITLFGVCILNKLIHLLAGKSLIKYMMVSATLYGAGYWSVRASLISLPHIGMFAIDLIFIGHMFYALGYCFRKTDIFEWITRYKVSWGFSVFVSIICTLLIGQYIHIAIDWPSRTFSHLLLDGWSAMNGTILVFTISLLIDHFLKRPGKLLRFIGKNTLGILFLHFTFFKVLYLPFYWLGIITRDDLSCITPGRMSSPVLEEKYWFVIATGALLLSLTVWRLLLHSKIICFFLGQNKQTYDSFWNTLMNTRLAARLIHIKNIFFALESAGNNLWGCDKEYGYYEDKWRVKCSQFQVKPDGKGEISIDIYCLPNDLYDKNIELHVNNVLADTIKVCEPLQAVSVNLKLNPVIRIKPETTFAQDSARQI